MQPGLLPVLRAPFGGTNAFVNETAASLGFAGDGSGSVGTLDFDPVRTAEQIRDAILAGLRPGRGIVLHDGPIDTAAGQATVDAVAMLIDEARARGYCFGVLDESGRVVAGRYTGSGQPIPQITNAVPYIPLAYPGTPPSPWALVPQPLRVDAAHSPAVFLRGGSGTITLTVSNPTADTPSDDNPTVVTHAIPAGLTATSASGDGWTCTTGATVSCTRMTVLAPGASLPPITIGVNVAADAPVRDRHRAARDRAGRERLGPQRRGSDQHRDAGPGHGRRHGAGDLVAHVGCARDVLAVRAGGRAPSTRRRPARP